MVRISAGLTIPAAMLVAASVCLAQSSEQPIIRESTLRMHLEYLTSTELMGRKALEPESRTAAHYIGENLLRSGLEPGASGRKFYQWVPVETFEFFDDQSVLVDSVRGDVLHGEKDFWMFPRKRISSVTGGVYLCGYGIQASEAGYDDFRNIDVSGKFVLAFLGEPVTKDTSSFFGKGRSTRYAMIPVKAGIAQRLGAVGLILTASPDRRDARWQAALEQKREDWESDIIQLSGDSEFPVLFLDPEDASAIVSRYAKLDLQQYQDQLSQDMTGSPIQVPELTLRLTPAFSDAVVDSVINVIAVLEGTPKSRGEAIIIAAHYDHLGTKDGRIYSGADDNASGVSALLTLAKAFGKKQPRLDRTIIFISFGAEEEGLIGSRYYAEHPVFPLDKTVAMLNMDCIGRDGSDSYRNMVRPPETEQERNLLFTFYSVDYPDLKELVLRMPNPGNLWLRPDPLTGSFDFGDHAPFLHRGVPVMFFFSGYTADYHTPEDTIDKIDFPKLTKVTTLIHDLITTLANDSTRIKRIEGKLPPSSSPMH